MDKCPFLKLLAAVGMQERKRVEAQGLTHQVQCPTNTSERSPDNLARSLMVAAAIDLDFCIFSLGLFRGKRARAKMGNPLFVPQNHRRKMSGCRMGTGEQRSRRHWGGWLQHQQRVFYSNQTKCKWCIHLQEHLITFHTELGWLLITSLGVICIRIHN